MARSPGVTLLIAADLTYLPGLTEGLGSQAPGGMECGPHQAGRLENGDGCNREQAEENSGGFLLLTGVCN